MNTTPIHSRFDEDFSPPWEQAFSKFGYGDGLYPYFTEEVVDSIEELGYTVQVNTGSIHNDLIYSIKKAGKELMPDADSRWRVGYDDPRRYLPVDIIQHLDEIHYGYVS